MRFINSGRYKYWPSASVTFEYDNKLMLNSYVESGYKPVDIDSTNKHAIDLFLAHINNVLTCEREQRILIDWLAYVVQNAGKRINWAILLVKILEEEYHLLTYNTL